MNKDRIIRLGRRISQSDLWNIGVEGIIEKQVDKLNMSDRLTDTTKLFIRGSLTAAIAGTSLACIKNGINPEVTSSNNQNTTEIAPTEKPFVIPTSTSEVNATMSYEFVEESEIISKLPGPFRAFGEDQRIKDLFEDPSTIEYSASGVKTVDITGKETTYVFFNATSEVEEKSRTAMIFGGDQGEVIYIVLNRIIDAEGRVGLGITQDPATGADLDKSIMIFNTELTEVELSQMTNEEIEARDILFIPGGLLVSPQEIFNVKMASLVKVEVPVGGVVFPAEMTDKYKNQFETFEYGVKQVNGVDTKVIYGIKSDETKQVIAMEMEIDGQMRMTRVGEHIVKDGEGNDHSFYTYIDPKWSSTGIFSVTDRTSKGIVGMPEGKNDANMWNSLAHQLGFATPEQAFEHVMVKNDGIFNFKVAYGVRSDPYATSKMKSLEHPANFNLPIEIRTIMTADEYNSLPDEIKNDLINDQKSKNTIVDSTFGYLLWTKPNGQIVIYSISTAAERWGYNNDSHTLNDSDRKMITDFYEAQVVYRIFDSMGMMVAGKSNLRSYARQSRNFLEIEGINFKDPSQ
ncbi:MAG: hypothetical protein QY322_00310 [bacterium]|nr:MAG: hypothetical protein QY322_00310 [bacterium]